MEGRLALDTAHALIVHFARLLSILTQETFLPKPLHLSAKPRAASLATERATSSAARWATAVVAAAAWPATVGAQANPVEATLPEVSVTGITPLPGLSLSREQIPAAVQVIRSKDIEKSSALDLADLLNRNLGSVHINEVQNNPFMADVNYRGYSASPLLGTPQGLSVYVDGVRMNQAFGDVVLWDLIPKAAMSSVTLMSGANPLFGLNTLGGALSIETKSGETHPGTVLEASLGQHGRTSLGLEHGGTNDQGLDWFTTATTYREDGWRDDSPSRVGQLFGKLGWKNAKSDAALTYTYANNALVGNGLQQEQLLAQRYNSVFTKPDNTDNVASVFNLRGATELSSSVKASGNVYWRHTTTKTLNGDLNEAALGQTGVYAGLINTTRTRQSNGGLSGQLTFTDDLLGHRNQAAVGMAYDTSKLNFRQAAQFGDLNADRSISPADAFADGTQNSSDAFDQRVNLDGRVRTWSVFGTDTLSIADTWHITASGRFNDTRLHNTDKLYPYNNATTQGEQRGSLDGNHAFRRFNPALGVSFTPSKSVNAYAGYSESSRAPTSVELGCADPNFGCRLPNAMAGDPPLEQVVSKTWEMGLRGKLPGQTRWSVGLFRGDNHDDIQFVANTASTGYFKNFGQTRRQGVEAAWSSAFGAVSWGVNYTYLQATYQSDETVGSEYNSTADAEGHIAVQRGDHLPLMPNHLLKANVAYAHGADWRTGLEMVAVSGSFVRGNENNRHQADGVDHLGSGRVPGYAVLNWSGSYKATARLQLLANVNNLFDRRYSTAGQLGPEAFDASGGFRNSADTSTTFYAPGAPRNVWLGLRYSL